jgi:MFS transporter, OFA family, oxalate/formate antiporter
LLGFLFMVIVVSAGWCMQDPPATHARSTVALNWRGILTQRPFRTLYLAMGCGLAAGFAVNANLKELLPGGRIEVDVTAVALFALANAFGRIVWGALYDRLPGRIPLGANLLFQALILSASPWVLVSELGMLILTGFNYGGVLVLYAASVARLWGRHWSAGSMGCCFRPISRRHWHRWQPASSLMHAAALHRPCG